MRFARKPCACADIADWLITHLFSEWPTTLRNKLISFKFVQDFLQSGWNTKSITVLVHNSPLFER